MSVRRCNNFLRAQLDCESIVQLADYQSSGDKKAAPRPSRPALMMKYSE